MTSTDRVPDTPLCKMCDTSAARDIQVGLAKEHPNQGFPQVVVANKRPQRVLENYNEQPAVRSADWLVDAQLCKLSHSRPHVSVQVGVAKKRPKRVICTIRRSQETNA